MRILKRNDFYLKFQYFQVQLRQAIVASIFILKSRLIHAMKSTRSFPVANNTHQWTLIISFDYVSMNQAKRICSYVISYCVVLF